MNKFLLARKMKDDWHVLITEDYCLKTETDVKKMIKANNLKIKTEFSNKNKIYAEL